MKPSAYQEREHWDRLSAEDPHTAIRHGDWSHATAHDFGMLPPTDHGPVLDLGCGVGRLAVAYAQFYGVEVIAVDISEKMLLRAEPHAKVRYCLGDGRALPLMRPLAAAWSMLMFQHIPPLAQESYVMQVAQRLEPGALFCFQTVIGTEDAFLSHQVDEDEPAAWCERAGLQVLSVDAGDLPEWQWVSARRVVDIGTCSE